MPGILNLLLAKGSPFSLDFRDLDGSDSALSPSNASALVQVVNDGSVNFVSNTGDDFQMVLTGDPTLLEIFVTGTGDTPSGSALDTWLSMGTTRSWSLTTTVLGELQFVGTYQIRVASTGQVLGGGGFSITADRFI